ncbi:uncharacterized protein LOC135489238 [Lineus longissimus]|uniref:uncharacterized protein LOC135489238 n=1 Tax=Lineus longissimus TaxID=88925 RepID=UPI002B4C52D1
MYSHRMTTSSGGSDPFFHRSGGSPSQPNIQGKEWKTEVDVKGFRTEDIKLSVDGNSISIHCVRDEDGSRRETRRQLQVPDGTDTSRLESEVNNSGTLVLKAPYETPKGNSNNNDPFTSFGGFSKMSGGMQSRMRGFDDKNDGKDFLTKVALPNFQVSEIQISAGGGRIIVKAHSKHGISTRMVDRSFDIPAKVNMAALAAILTEDGTVFIGAPIPDSIKGKAVEITKE